MAGYLKSRRCDRMNRRVHDALTAHDHENSFHVWDSDGKHHGQFRTVSEARGCVEFDNLCLYAITKGDWALIEGRFS
jgi:L-ribulose-5-phosphate 3-epimerase UlaE